LAKVAKLRESDPRVLLPSPKNLFWTSSIRRFDEKLNQAAVEAGSRPGMPAWERQRIQELEREIKELRRANEILKLASAFFAQAELDRRCKR